MSTGDIIQLLLIEDDKGDKDLVRELLSENHGLAINVVMESTLKEGLERLTQESFDIILLDLTLPDSNGLNTFLRIHQHVPDIPVVVLAGMRDDFFFSTQAVSIGAQDYLIKSRMDTELLLRSIRYAIERNRLQRELEQSRHLQRQSDEILSLERLSKVSGSPITAEMLGKQSLKEGFHEIFATLMEEYGGSLDLAVEQRIYKITYNLNEAMMSLAQRLGILKAGPRDVVDIHSEALKGKIVGVNFAKAQIYVEEGRLTLLSLMGNLLSFYRNYYITFRRPSR